MLPVKDNESMINARDKYAPEVEHHCPYAKKILLVFNREEISEPGPNAIHNVFFSNKQDLFEKIIEVTNQPAQTKMRAATSCNTM